jgi:hypothetical protein
MTYDYDDVRARQEERIGRSLAAYGLPRRVRDCPLERLVKWIAARRRATFDSAPLAR